MESVAGGDISIQTLCLALARHFRSALAFTKEGNVCAWWGVIQEEKISHGGFLLKRTFLYRARFELDKRPVKTL